MSTMNNTTILAYEKINEKYSKAKYGEFNVIIDMTNGYINATKLCADGSKRFENWIRNNGNKELIEFFETTHALNFEYMKITITGGKECIIRGTYVHPDLIPHIASWVSSAFAYKVSKIVNNFLVREKEDEIRILSGDKSRLEKMLEESEKRRKEDAEKAEKMLQKMIDQNEKTHFKLDDTKKVLNNTEKILDKAEIDNQKIKNVLHRVETRVEKLVEEVVPPVKQVSLHEQFGIMKLYDENKEWQYKVYCSQKRGVEKAKSSILKKYPNAKLIFEIKPNPNSKNLLHKLKELYGKGKDAKFYISYNFLNLKDGISEEELKKTIDDVLNDKKNFASD